MNLTKLKKELTTLFKDDKEIDQKIIFDLLKNYNQDDWKDYVFFDENNYKRNYVYKSELFDIIVICWAKWQSTKIHWHPKKGCYFKVLEWKLQENLFEAKTNKLKINILEKNNITFEHDSIGIHKVSNTSDNNAVWLYIYQSAWDYNPNDNYEWKRGF